MRPKTDLQARTSAMRWKVDLPGPRAERLGSAKSRRRTQVGLAAIVADRATSAFGRKDDFKSERSYGEIVGLFFPSMISATHASAPRSKPACWSRASRRPRISDVLAGPGQSALERRARTRCITTAMAFRSSADIASRSRLSFRFGWFSRITWDWMPRPSSASRIT